MPVLLALFLLALLKFDLQGKQSVGGREKRERDPERGSKEGGDRRRSTCKSKKGGNNTMKENNIKICGCNREVAV